MWVLSRKNHLQLHKAAWTHRQNASPEAWQTLLQVPRAPKIDLHRPLVERVVFIRRPIGTLITVDDKIRRLRLALGRPASTRYLTALERRRYKLPLALTVLK